MMAKMEIAMLAQFRVQRSIESAQYLSGRGVLDLDYSFGSREYGLQ